MLLNSDVLVACICLIFTLLFVKVFLYLRKLPPGPFPLPFVGSLYALKKKGNYEQQLALWSKKYGDIMTVWYGWTPVYVVSSWDLIHEAAMVKRNDFIDKHKTFSLQTLMGNRQGISGENGMAWEVLRKAGIIIARKYAASSEMPKNVNWGLELTLKSHLKLGDAFNPQELILLVMHYILFAAVFGRREKADEEMEKVAAIPAVVREGFTGSLWSDYIPLYRLFTGKRMKRFTAIMEEFIIILKGNIHRHAETFQPDRIRDFTDAFLSFKEQYQAEMKAGAVYFTEENIAQLLFEFYQGGSDTTGVTLLWMLKLLAHNAEIQEKIWLEVQDAIGNQDILPEFKERCPYIQAVILETQRYFTPVTTGFMRRATIDTELGGYQIPKHGAVLFNYYAPSRDPKLWTEPDQFRPDRFLDETGNILKSQFPGLLPFGIGKRMCPGDRLAMDHNFLITTALVRRFRLSVPESEKGMTTDTEPTCVFAIPKPFKIILTERVHG